MKAIVQSRFGTPDDLDFMDIVSPTIGADDVLIAVRAASVGPWVWRMIGPDPRIMRLAGAGLLRPKRSVPGADLAGVVEQVGRSVTDFAPGDEVYGEALGAYAEFAVANQAHIATKPRNLSFEEAAAVPIAAGTALIGLRDKGRVAVGQRVLIIGAAGGVGTFAVQIAKVMGAHVTGVCSSKSIDLVRSLGADEVVDYTKQDFTALPERYDVVFQLAGELSSTSLRRVLTPTGTLVLSSGEGGHWVGAISRLLVALVTSPFVDHQLTTFVAHADRKNLEYLTSLIECGQLRPVVERIYALGDASEAIRQVEAGHAQGKTVITI